MYHTLENDDLINLRLERLRGLEADHARQMLLREEAGPSNAGAMEWKGASDALEDIQRRIDVHRTALGLAMPEPDAPPHGDGAGD